MEELSLPDVLVLTAAGMFVIGYLILNQIVLRCMLLIGTALYICYYAVVDSSPLWSAIWASTATGTANLIGLFSLLYRRSVWAIPRPYRDLYVNFKVLPPGDFRKLVKLATRVTRPAGYRLTRSGRPVETLYFIISGSVEIGKDSGVFSLSNNSFVGEVGYLTGGAASATTVLEGESEVLEWNVAQLRDKVVRDPQLGLAMDTMISFDLARKVARSGGPDRRPERILHPT